MDLSTFSELLTPSGQEALAAAEALPPGDEAFLANLARLDKRVPTPLAKAVLETATLRAGAYDRGGETTFVAGDFPRLPLPAASAFFFDPARRVGGRRKFSVRQYAPPLEAARGWLPRIPAGGVKISPGVNLDELAGYD